jgi:hypothetical protein
MPKAKAMPKLDPWKALARDAILSLANSERRFTSDNVWEILGDHTLGDRRKLGAVLKEAERQGIIRKGELEVSTRSARHKAPVRIWISNKNEPLIRDRQEVRQNLQIKLEVAILEAKVNKFAIASDWLDGYGGLHRLDSGPEHTRLRSIRILDDAPSSRLERKKDLQTALQVLWKEITTEGFEITIKDLTEYGENPTVICITDKQYLVPYLFDRMPANPFITS